METFSLGFVHQGVSVLQPPAPHHTPLSQDTVFKRQIVSASLSGMKESNILQVATMAEELQRLREKQALVPRAPTVPEKARRLGNLSQHPPPPFCFV